MLARSSRTGGRGALLKIFSAAIFLATLVFLYELSQASSRLMDSRPEALHRPASEVEDGYWWGESQEVHIKSWRGKAGDSQMTTEPRQHEQLAVLLPCWSDCAQGSILVLYLSNLLRQQGGCPAGHVYYR